MHSIACTQIPHASYDINLLAGADTSRRFGTWAVVSNGNIQREAMHLSESIITKEALPNIVVFGCRTADADALPWALLVG